MVKPSFRVMLEFQWSQGKFSCVGLDTDAKKVRGGDVLALNRRVITSTASIVCAYKPNVAFYEAQGSRGHAALKATIAFIRENAPEVPIILDVKRADIGVTSAAYARAAFDVYGADAVTVNPYLGADALAPFLERGDKGIIVLCKTSNPGSAEFQNLRLEGGELLYQRVARNVAEQWNSRGNCALVVGATYPRELAEVRSIVGDELPILIPGIGTQGGDLVESVRAGRNSKGTGILVNSSSKIIYASDPEAEARLLDDGIRNCIGGE